MKRQKSQLGSAHLIVIAIVIVLIGALGFVYWQNNIKNKEVSVKNNLTVTKVDNDNSVANKIEDNNTQTKAEEPTEQIFSDALFTFDYPDTGWTIKANTLNGYEKTGYVSLESDDYKSGPMGSEQGSSIGIGADEDVTDIVSLIDYYNDKNMISNLSNITVDGQTAYKYLFSYEFGYYNTLFERNGKNYQVMLDGPNEESLEVYNTVLTTLEVKMYIRTVR